MPERDRLENHESGTGPGSCQSELPRLREDLARARASEAAARLVIEKLQAERDAFRLAFDNAPFMLVWCDRKGRALRLNRATRTAMDDHEPLPDFNVYNDPQLIMLGVPEFFDRALAGETVHMPRYVFNVSKTHLGAPDKDIHMETSLYPVFADDGTVDSVVVRHDDVTALALAERELERLRSLLAAAGVDAGPDAKADPDQA